MTQDLKETVFLPRTGFPMRAGLAENEPRLLQRWQQMELYRRLRRERAAAPRYVLHDGPPYANGTIHIGHATNKILKDVIVRAHSMLGFDAPYVPGWDCHGLPIEWKVEEALRAAGKRKDDVPALDFRAQCRAFAQHWVDVQRDEFQRLGVLGDWEKPYTTMAFAAEAAIVGEIHRFLLNGLLYRGARPVFWSVVEKTALAEAEVEYDEHRSTTVWVRFPVVTAATPALQGADIVIWTTTPWTLPANRAIAFGPALTYAVYEVTEGGARVQPGARLAVAAKLAEQVRAEAGIAAWRLVAELPGHALGGTLAAHPLRGSGYDYDVPLLPGEHVTDDAGTGFVHTAPAHGEDDWRLGQAHGLPVGMSVGDDGAYLAHVPLFAGKRIFDEKGREGDANRAVVAAIEDAGRLLHRGTLLHSYPHSWRSKAPLIFRATPQWFIALDQSFGGGPTLRARALTAIEATRFVPEAGRNRLRSMVESRPDWCVSRQRAWGVPIAVFVEKATGEVLRDPMVCQRIQEAFAAEGADAWWMRDPADFLGDGRDPGAYERITDIIDVWFESGSTHAFVLEQRPELAWPADLYLEGSDQHRGWFQSSLLEGCGTRQRAPFGAVLTHGFVLDEQGRKMSKSVGNVVAPQSVVDRDGADILRLWVVAQDYTEDTRIGQQILKGQVEAYRRFRNTLRYLLGAVDGMTPAERDEPHDLPELERFMLHRLKQLDGEVRAAIQALDFTRLSARLQSFCASELSAFYLDVRKDALYCDPADSARRRGTRFVMRRTLDALLAWLAPLIPFTAEEAWLAGGGDPAGSVHLTCFPALPSAWIDPELERRFERLKAIRRVVTGALEPVRAAKTIGSSLEAAPVLWLADPADRQLANGIDMAELCIVSALAMGEGAAPADAFRLDDVPGVAVAFRPAPGAKCERCWRVLPEVGRQTDPRVCARCEGVLRVSAGAQGA